LPPARSSRTSVACSISHHVGTGERGELDGHVADSSEAEHGDGVAGTGSELLDRAVRGDAGAEQRGSVDDGADSWDACVNPLALDHVQVRSIDSASGHLNEDLAIGRLGPRRGSPVQGRSDSRAGASSSFAYIKDIHELLTFDAAAAMSSPSWTQVSTRLSGVERHAFDALLQEPLGQVGVVRQALTSPASSWQRQACQPGELVYEATLDLFAPYRGGRFLAASVVPAFAANPRLALIAYG
jgi:hypothetical protein